MHHTRTKTLVCIINIRVVNISSMSGKGRSIIQAITEVASIISTKLLASSESKKATAVCVYKAMEYRMENINALIERLECKCFDLESRLEKYEK